MKYKESRIVNGIFRIIEVVGIVAFIVGEIVIYGTNAAIEPSAYTDLYGRTLYNEGKSFDTSGFIGWSFLWIVILFIAYLIVIYLINGFRSKSEVGEKPN